MVLKYGGEVARIGGMTTRREFFLAGGAMLAASRLTASDAQTSATPRAERSGGDSPVRFGIVTDLHYADIDPDPKPCGVVGRRYYRDSLRKLSEAVESFNRSNLDFAIELGDFKDNTHGRERTIEHLDAIEDEFAKFNGPRYHVAGNHDFDCLTNEEFFSRIPNDGEVSMKGYYSFERGGITFIVLNACFDSTLMPYSRNNPWNDANVPPDELRWFKAELAAAPGKVVVFCHQRMDDACEPNHQIKNAATLRSAIEKSGKVCVVITGHQHCGGYHILNGIPYYSLRAMVCEEGEGENSFAVVSVSPNGDFEITGSFNAASVSRKARRQS